MKMLMTLSTSGTWKDWLFFAASSFVMVTAQPTSPSSTAPTSPTSTPSEPEQDTVILGTVGNTLNISWPLPRGLREGTLMVVAFNTPSAILFLTTLPTTNPLPLPDPGPSSSTIVMPDYSGRVEVIEPWTEGLVQFTLSNVTFDDGGRYICTRGMTEADIIEDCGKILVVLDAPVNARITTTDTPLIGNDVTLRCTATSTSTPRDHRQPMTFRWFEAQTTENSGNPQTWTEIPNTGVDNFSRKLSSGQDRQNGDEAGSGEIDQNGNHSGSLSDVLTLTSLTTKDEGRVFACDGSEGLGLWSTKSEAFVLRPEWKPTTSDLTLTPAGSSMTLTSGESKVVTCQAKCRPECQVSWKKVTWDNRSMTVAGDGTLDLTEVGPQHQGLYQCQASNRHGSASTPFTLSVLDPPTPWYLVNRNVIILTAIVTVGLALGMIGVAVVVYKCRQRTTPFVWPHRRANHDAVPLSALENRYLEAPSLSSYI